MASAAPGTISTPIDFAHALEKALGVPQSANNDAFLVAWQQSEGNPGWGYHNPFNTSQTEKKDVLDPSKPGSSKGIAGVSIFPDWATGIKGTVDALMSGSGAWYASIRADLAKSANPIQTAADTANTPWASGHYGRTAANPGGTIESILQGAGFNPAGITATAYIPGTNIHVPGTGAGSTLLPSNPVTGAVGTVVGDLTRWVDSIAIRAALVLFGAIAIIVGIAIMAKSGDDEHKADEEGHEEATVDKAAARAAPAPRPSGPSRGTSAPQPSRLEEAQASSHRLAKSRGAPGGKVKSGGRKIAGDVEATGAGAAAAAL